MCLIRRWTAFQKLGVARVSTPGMYYSSMNLDPGTTMGGYHGVTTPEEPILVHMVANPNKPGLAAKGTESDWRARTADHEV